MSGAALQLESVGAERPVTLPPGGRLARLKARDRALAARTRARIAEIVFGVLVSLFLVEACARIVVVAGHPHRARPPEFGAKLLVAKDPVTDGKPLLFLGGSFIQRAVFPELLRERLKTTGIAVHPKNLGCRVSCLQQHLTLLQAALSSSKEKPVVFYDLRHEAFRSSFIENEKVNESAQYLDTYLARKHYGVKDLKARLWLFLEDNLCVVRDRAYLRDQLFNIFTTVFCFDKAYEQKFQPVDVTKAELSQLGSTATYIVMTGDEFRDHVVDQNRKFDWNESLDKDWSLAWFNQFRQCCEENGAPLVLLWLPECTPPGAPEPTRRDSELKARFQKLADNKHVWFIDMHKLDNDTSHFMDRRHCNQLGAIVATDWLATRLQAPDMMSLLKEHTH